MMIMELGLLKRSSRARGSARQPVVGDHRLVAVDVDLEHLGDEVNCKAIARS